MHKAHNHSHVKAKPTSLQIKATKQNCLDKPLQSQFSSPIKLDCKQDSLYQSNPVSKSKYQKSRESAQIIGNEIAGRDGFKNITETKASRSLFKPVFITNEQSMNAKKLQIRFKNHQRASQPYLNTSINFLDELNHQSKPIQDSISESAKFKPSSKLSGSPIIQIQKEQISYQTLKMDAKYDLGSYANEHSDKLCESNQAKSEISFEDNNQYFKAMVHIQDSIKYNQTIQNIKKNDKVKQWNSFRVCKPNDLKTSSYDKSCRDSSNSSNLPKKHKVNRVDIQNKHKNSFTMNRLNSADKFKNFDPCKNQKAQHYNQLTSKIAEMNLSSSSGSKNYQGSDYVEQNKIIQGKIKSSRRKNKGKTRKKVYKACKDKKIHSIVMNLDFLEDEGDIQQITPRQYSKPLEQAQQDVFRSRSFAQKVELTSQSSISDSEQDHQLSINKSINIPYQIEQQPSELEFLTSDQVQNFDNLFSFNNQQDNHNDKLNVSLQSEEENKILKLNGCNLEQIKSSPLVRPKIYKVPSISPPRPSQKQEDSDQEELTHNEIILKLLAKLQNEQKSPTKLKVQQNIQRNVNFYEEPEAYKIESNDNHQFFQSDFNGFQNGNFNVNGFNLQPQQQYQLHQPFRFQLNPCFEIPCPQINNGPSIMNYSQQQPNLPLSNFGIIQESGEQSGSLHFNSGLNEMQIKRQLDSLIYQQQAQLSTMANMFNIVTLPPILTDLDTQMRSLPIQMQYALVTDEHYLHRQFQIVKLLQIQQQGAIGQHMGQLNNHLDFNINQFHSINQGSTFVQNYGNNEMMANNLHHQAVQQCGTLPQQVINFQNSNFNTFNFEPTIYNQLKVPSFQQSNNINHIRQTQNNQQQINQQVHFNKHELAFINKLKPIGFKQNANNYKSAFAVTPNFAKNFLISDDIDLSQNSLDGSTSKLNGSPDNMGRAQSIFSEQTYQLQCSPLKKSNSKQKANRLIQMTANINQMYDKVQKYKKARQKCLEEIRTNKPQVDYIKTKSDKQKETDQTVHQNQFANQSNDIILQNTQKEQTKLGLQSQEYSFGEGNRPNTSPSIYDINGYSGLSKNDNLILPDDYQFEEKLKFDRKNSKRYQRDQNEEIGLGSGGEYVLKKNQIIISPENEKYKIVQYLGQGTFGQVVKCINLRKGTQHAVKIIKNKTEFILQGMVEIKILEKLNNSSERTEFEKQHLIKMEDYFVFRDYLCLIFELLQSSLYETIQESERGLNLAKVREYTRQILEALVTCKDASLIHCDLKPENILTAKDGLNVKLIDFGSAAFNGHQVYTYIQSRYYRAPEVLMGCQKYSPHNYFGEQLSVPPTPLYDQSIDMWSLGCTAIEMFIKIPIFPGKYDYDQLLKILEFCGMPNQQMILNGQNRDRFFYYNLQQQRYVFKTFYDFVMTMVPPHMQDKVEQPMNYHQHYDFRQLIESHYLQQLKREKYQRYMIQQREIAADTKNHCFLPFVFEYTYDEKLQIDQFIDFVQQILLIDQNKRLTPLQALSHPFITGVNLPLPFIAHPEMHLKRFRQANLLDQKEENLSSRADIEFQMNDKNEFLLPISDSQRSISAPLPKRFSIWKFFKTIEQKNGSESFRPPVYALPENIFYGNCCETTISEFYQESKIRFQLHQDENNHAEIDYQRELLESHQFCDVIQEDILLDKKGNKILDNGLAKEVERKSNISVLEIKRQKSILQIKEDKSIKQPKVTENEKFIRELLQRDVINFVHEEAEIRNQYRIKEEQKQADSSFQLIDDYFVESHFSKQQQPHKVVKNYEYTAKQSITRTQSSLFEDNYQLSASRRGLFLIKKEKERSNSSDTIQKQQIQQPEISLFSQNPIIHEELDCSNDNISSPISSIKSDQYCHGNINMQENFKSHCKFKSQIQQSAASQIQKHQKLTKPTIEVSKFGDNNIERSSLEYDDEKVKPKRKKKQKLLKVKTPIKNQEFAELENGYLDDKNCHFGSTKAGQNTKQHFPYQPEPFSQKFFEKSQSVYGDGECVPSHSGSDFDTEHDTDYGKHQYKKFSENNAGSSTDIKASTSVRNNTFSNNNSFENPDYLEQLSGSIKGIANNNGNGIRCLRSKRSKMKKKRRN